MTASRTGSSKPFSASLVRDVRFLGAFESVREAQIEVEKAAGRLLRWVTVDRVDSVESYRGEEIL